jgi:hypothetical protein
VQFCTALEARITRGDKVYRTDSYKPPMPPRELKGTSITRHLADYVLGPMWRDREQMRPQFGESLATYCGRLQEYPRVGPFLAAQIVADLKHAGPLRSAPDWWAFAAPGPGSERSLNRVLGRPITTQWNEAHWHHELMRLKAEADPLFAEAGMAPVDAQNLQSVLCEFDKWERARERGGKPSRKYKAAASATAAGSGHPPVTGIVADELAAVTPPPPGPETIPAHILADIAGRAQAAEPPPVPPGGTSDEARAKGPPPPPPPGGGAGRASNGYPRGERDTGREIAFYIYLDARGRHYLGVKRTTTKQFPQYHWNGTQWIKGLPKGFLKIPYRLPELLDAPADAWVVIAAGEKDAETVARLGFAATTNPGGEGKGQWTPELNKWFAGKKRVAIMEDNDKAGYAHAIEVANALRGIVPDIRIVQFRELKAGGDLTDWVKTDPKHDHAALLARIEAAPAA